MNNASVYIRKQDINDFFYGEMSPKKTKILLLLFVLPIKTALSFSFLLGQNSEN